MATAFEYQDAFRLGDRLKDLTPEEFVALIQGLCQAVQSRTEDFFGGVNAGNISLTPEGDVGLGDALGAPDVQYTADQIEYLAPEVFWKNERNPQADVYAVGLLMYTWANGGCLPFLYPDAPATDRAEALRRRMSGEAFDIPQVSHSLGAIVEKATEFSAGDRYADCGALLDAFQAFVSEVEVDNDLIAGHVETQRRKRAEEEQMMAGILAAAEAATVPQQVAQPVQYQPDGRTSGRRPERRSHGGRPLVVVLALAAILMVAAVAMQFTNTRNHENDLASASPTPTAKVGDTLPTPPVETGMPAVTGTPVPDTTPEPTATPTATPKPTPTPTQSPAAEHTYSLYWEDVSWNQAADKCMALGGNLVVINDEEEFKKVTALADTYGVNLVWVGGFRKDGEICWVNGETSDYYPWAAGEPSVRDADGTAEPFLMLWKINGVWYYNDNRDDPIDAYPAAYSGKIAYICEKP